MKRLIYIALGALLLSTVACERIFMEQEPKNDPQTNFESMWTTLDHKYSFFNFKQIDWDSVKTAYQSQINPEMSEEQLFDVLANMLFELRDGHVNLLSPFDRSRNWQWYLDYPENFDASLVEREYLGDDYRTSGPLLNTIIDSVGYVRYSSFSSNISSSSIDFVINRFQGLKGVIIDVRNNGGGSLSNVDQLVSRFADEERLVWNTYYKTGPGHDDFSNPIAKYIQPEGEQQFTGPIVILSNRKSYSATSFFIQAMKAFPYVTIVGDRCGGGSGAPISHELPNGWIYRFSADKSFSPNGFNFEHGIPVDIEVNLDADSAELGYDTMIERAKGLVIGD